MPPLRLQKYLSQAGVASRRKAEELILQGKIRVNDVIVRQLGTQVDPDIDRVQFDGRRLLLTQKFSYLLFHKPSGVVVTKHDPERRKTVYDCIPHLDPSANAVGRLDLDSEGLLLFTNDGDLAYRLTHPSYEIVKKYEVCLKTAPSPTQIRQLEMGVELEDGITAPARIRPLKKKDKIWFSVEIHEGKKRQVRRMFEWAGCRVLRLVRVKLGPLSLGDLAVGKSRVLTTAEIQSLNEAAGRPSKKLPRSSHAI